MKFEHFALNVSDARAFALWYVNHLGLRVVRSRDDAPYTKFLADDTGRVVVEVYSNTSVQIPDHRLAPPLNFHIGFVSDDPKATAARLEAAGATVFQEETLADGTLLMMMRDPWGVPLQFCRRTKPF